MEDDDTKDSTQVTEVTQEPEESDKSENSDKEDKSNNKTDSEPSNTSGESGASDLSDQSESSESSESDTEPAKITGRIILSDKIDVKGAYWYVVHTYSGHEAKVAATLKQRVESQKLADKVLEILVPTQEKIEIKEGKKSKVREKIFPGYILIKMVLDDQSWLAVRTTPGITSFVGNLNKPTPLPESEVATIQRFIQMEAPKFKTTFSLGEAVKIVDGPFSEFLGSVQEMDEEKGKVKVLVSIFGRETPVELDFLQIAKL